jgi:hypothetical protein
VIRSPLWSPLTTATDRTSGTVEPERVSYCRREVSSPLARLPVVVQSSGSMPQRHRTVGKALPGLALSSNLMNRRSHFLMSLYTVCLTRCIGGAGLALRLN